MGTSENGSILRFFWSEAAILALITAVIYGAGYWFETAFLVANGVSFQLAIVTKESMLLGVAPVALFGVILYFAAILTGLPPLSSRGRG
jgi:hypothetical protein